MGCCGSSIPDVIIPDPENGAKHDVLIKPTGFLSRDQYVYQDRDTEKKWLFLDKDGGIFSNPKYFLENFIREDGKGQVLCAAKLDITELTKCSKGEHIDSDVSDYSNSSSDDDVRTVAVIKEKIKWAQKIKVKFYSDRGMDHKIAELKVKAKGKAKKTTVIETYEDSEGNEQQNINVDVEKKVKKLLYKMEEMEGETEMPEIVLDGKLKGSEKKLEWRSPMFKAKIDGKMVTVETEWKHAGLAMLAGYICAKELAPNDIAANVHIF